MTKERNYGVDFMRVSFMLIMSLWHFGGLIDWLKHGYLAVDFYFALSGYYIFMSFKHKKYSPIEYLSNRLKRFIPSYLIVLGVMIIIKYKQFVPIQFNLDYFFEKIIGLLPQILLLQTSGIYDGLTMVNNPMWYLSVLIIGGSILYCWLSWNEKLTLNLLLPVVVYIGYIILFSQGKSLDYLWGSGFPMIRGLSNMGMGIIIGKFTYSYHNRVERHFYFYNVMSIICYSLFILLMLPQKAYDYYCVILIPFILIGLTLPNKATFSIRNIFNNSIWGKLGGISYEMYLLHMPIGIVFLKIHKEFTISIIVLTILYIATLLIFSNLLKKLVGKIFNVI